MVQALGINNDNYKMGIKIRIYNNTRYGTRFTRYDTSFWYMIIYRLHQSAGLVGTPREQAGVVLDGEWMDEG